MRPVTIEFFKPRQGRRYRSVLHRRDGLLVEDGLALEAGLWGVLSSGGMYRHARVIAGRRPPHFAARAQAVVDAAGDRPTQAEMLTRFVCDLARDGADRDVARLRAATGERWWLEVTPDRLAATCAALRDAGVRWRDLPPGEALAVAWRLPPLAVR